MQRYYQLDDGEKEADLYLFGALSSYGQWSDDDPDRSAYNIVAELAAVKAPVINVHINSAGGEVSQGLAIYNTLKESGKQITTYCDGFACSAASVVFMAGGRRVMQAASLLMIHNAWTYALGNAGELRKAADDVEIVTQASVEAYKTVATINQGADGRGNLHPAQGRTGVRIRDGNRERARSRRTAGVRHAGHHRPAHSAADARD